MSKAQFQNTANHIDLEGLRKFSRQVVNLTIAGSKDNYRLPPGCDFRVSAVGDVTVSGFGSDPFADGQEVCITSVGSGTLTLAHEGAGSAARNRISSGTGADVAVAPGKSVVLAYDKSIHRFRLRADAASGGAAAAAGSWAVAYARRVLDASPNDGGEVDTGINLEPDYEYIFALKLVSHGPANYADATNTVKILQVLPHCNMTVTPTVGGGVNEVDGGVPNRILIEELPPSDVNGKSMQTVGAGAIALAAGVGSVVFGAFDFIDDTYPAYLPGQGTYFVIKGAGDIKVNFGDSGNLTGLDLIFVLARRKVG